MYHFEYYRVCCLVFGNRVADTATIAVTVMVTVTVTIAVIATVAVTV